MKLKRALEVLKMHQQWRLGEIDAMPFPPSEISDAMNIAIDTLEVLVNTKQTPDKAWDLGTK